MPDEKTDLKLIMSNVLETKNAREKDVENTDKI